MPLIASPPFSCPSLWTRHHLFGVGGVHTISCVDRTYLLIKLGILSKQNANKIKMKRRYDWIDYSRFAAALSVVAFHYLFNGIAGGKVFTFAAFEPITEYVKYGYLGVDLFFIISGFVILNSASGKTADQFAVGRALRLYPAFLICMTFTAAVSLFWGGPDMTVNWRQYVANLTMLQKAFGQPGVDGVYWTLFYEIQFYVAVCFLILLNQVRRLETIVLAWAALLVLGNAIAPSLPLRTVPLLGGYFTYFASGCLFAYAYRDGFKLRTIAALCALAYTAVQFGLAKSAAIEASHHVLYSQTLVSIIIISFYVLFALFKMPSLSAIKLPRAQLFGGLTYPLYLSHAHLGYMVFNRFGDQQNQWILVLLMVCVSISLAYLVHTRIEHGCKDFSMWALDSTIGKIVRAVMAVLRGGGGPTLPSQPT